MDVQAAASSASATATLPPPPSGISVPTLSDVTSPAPVPAVAPTPPSGGSSTGSVTTSIGTFPAPAAPDAPKTLSSDVSKLLDPSGSGTQVSFRIASGTDQTVVVVTDKTTGKTIVQFPSETLIALAQFFDKLDGSVVDKKV